jgi:hypothetical protein
MAQSPATWSAQGRPLAYTRSFSSSTAFVPFRPGYPSSYLKRGKCIGVAMMALDSSGVLENSSPQFEPSQYPSMRGM